MISNVSIAAFRVVQDREYSYYGTARASLITIGIEVWKARLACYNVVWAVLAQLIGAVVAFASHKIVTGAAVGGCVVGFVATSKAAGVFAHE